MKKSIKRIDTGLFIPVKVLEEAGIEKKEVILEVREKEIRILPDKIIALKKPLTETSSIWKSIGIGEVDFNGREHDAGIYE